jgi:hypothetical protein
MNHSRSVPACLEMCICLEMFTLDMDFGGNILGAFMCVWRCAQVQRFLLWTRTLDKTLHECSSVSGDAEYFYSGHGLGRNHSRSVPVCLETCTSPEILLQTWTSEETVQECSSAFRDVYKSGVFFSRHVLRGITQSKSLWTCAHLQAHWNTPGVIPTEYMSSIKISGLVHIFRHAGKHLK